METSVVSGKRKRTTTTVTRFDGCGAGDVVVL